MKKFNATPFILEITAFSTTFLIVLGIYYFGFGVQEAPPKHIERREPTPVLKSVVSKEDVMTAFINDYLKDLQSSDWRKKIPAYFPGTNFDAAIKSHAKFRKAFSNYKIAVKHLAFVKNEAILWIKVKAKHVGAYDENEMKNIEPTGKNLEWEEVWNFEIQDGKFVGQGDFMDNGIMRLKQLGVKYLP